jgi:hypothetical protein
MVISLRRMVLGLMTTLLAPPTLQGQIPDSSGWEELGTTLGARPVIQPGAYRYNFPRSDLTVHVGDVTIAPALALTSWAAFAENGASTLIMGDLVVTASELPPLLDALSAAGIAVTAVHNHLVSEEPRVMYVHYHGQGEAKDLAAGLARAISVTTTPRPVAASRPAPVTIDTAQIRAAFHTDPKANGATASVSIRLLPSEIQVDGRPVPVAVGLLSPINFQRVTDQRWLSTGDFAVTAPQVQPIVRALAEAGITTTAIHSHLIGETPTVYFIHFWADGHPAQVLSGLAAVVKAANAEH